jgi:hypothetical protein
MILGIEAMESALVRWMQRNLCRLGQQRKPHGRSRRGGERKRGKMPKNSSKKVEIKN